MALTKKQARYRRAAKTRFVIRSLGATRLCVNRSNKHLYAQIISSCGSKTLASVSTLDVEIKSNWKSGSGLLFAAKLVGEEIARRAIASGVDKVAFDRGGYRYHGCIKALAEASREIGLQF